MKNTLKEKFKNNLLVKPLYRKLKNRNKIRPKVLWSVDSVVKLDGEGIHVKRNIVNSNKTGIKSDNYANKRLRSSVSNDAEHSFGRKEFNRLGKSRKMLVIAEHANGSKNTSDKAGSQKIPYTWLRVYPAPKRLGEPVCSVLIRCVLCQIGLFTSLVLWTIFWLFVIQSFEGPFEQKVTIEFDKEQNQLVIDLATELRQITPLSANWRSAIEDRLQQERHLTILAVGRGARLHPGQFWDISGTFLFTVYVMTALGFGAPVPHTIKGRSSSLIYAIVAVPTHIYLMLNASSCIVTNVEVYFMKLKHKPQRLILTRMANEEEKGCSDYSQNSKLLKPSNSKCRKKILRVLCMMAGHYAFIAAVVYYTCGAIGFGVFRRKTTLDAILFPLEFTTSGGLEDTIAITRVLYGFYVEGAMMVIACALATLRRNSSGPVTRFTQKYRLFYTVV